MKLTMQGISNFAYRSIQIISIALMFILSLSAFLLTCYAENMTTQQVLTKWDNPFINLLGIAVFLGIFYVLIKFFTHNAKRIPILLGLVMGWCLLLGAILIVFSKTVPAADAWSVYDIAQNLAMGNTAVIHPTESYLSYYPQQVGLVVFLEALIRFWNLLPLSLPAYHFIKCVYVLLLCITVFYQYKIVHFLWNNVTADCTYLLLAAANLPWIMYSSFVYGEIPSFAMISVGVYYLLRILGNCHGASAQDTDTSAKLGKSQVHIVTRQVWLHAILSLVALTLAVMLRKNSLIFIIAIIIVVLCHWLQNRRHGLLLYTALCVALSMSILPIVQTSLENRADNYLQTGVPAMSYFAMGMQESSRGNGWYNAFNFDTYQATGMDTDATVAISKEAIAERLDYFAEHPDYAANFYLQKYLTQWVDGTYASRQATLATFGGRNDFFNQLYVGEYSNFFIGYCNIYQNVIYLACLVFFVRKFANNRKVHKSQVGIDKTIQNAMVNSHNFAPYLGIICVLGGFLFHMIWEANSRYIFLYSLMLLPYAAKGIVMIINTIPFKHNNH